MRRFLAFAMLLLNTISPATAGERLRVAMPSDEQELVQALIEKVAAAVSAEDYAAYVSCFTPRARTKTLPPELFVTTDMEVTLGKWVITNSTSTKTSVVLAYTMTRDGEDTRYVSRLDCRHDGTHLLVHAESGRVVGTSSNTGSTYSASNSTCATGRCGLTQPPPNCNRGNIPICIGGQCRVP